MPTTTRRRNKLGIGYPYGPAGSRERGLSAPLRGRNANVIKAMWRSRGPARGRKKTTGRFLDYDHVLAAVARGSTRICRGWYIRSHCAIFSEPSMADAALEKAATGAPPEATVVAALGRRSMVLVGMMGAGKSSVGRRLAARLGIP